MRWLAAPLALVLAASVLISAESPGDPGKSDPGKVVRKTHSFRGAERGYFLYEPADPKAGESLPLIITLHGSGGDVRMLVDAWRETAARERIVVIGPEAASGRGWDAAADPPELFQWLVDEAAAEYGVDDRRVHLFGFSAGGHFALTLAMLEPEYFAAAAVYAGVLMPELNDVAAAAERRIPILLIGGRNDTVVAPQYMVDTRDRLNARGWQVPLHMLNNGHNYRLMPGNINKLAWALFKDARLEQEPKFKKYRFQ